MPSDRRWIDVQPNERVNLFGRQGVRIGFLDVKLLQTFQLDRRKVPLTVDERNQPVEQRLVRLRVLVKHSRVDLRGEEIVRRSDRVNVAGQMKIEFFHRNDLSVTATRRSPFDAERRPLTRLAKTTDDVPLQMRAERLTQADRRRALPFAQRRRRDARNDDVFAVRRVFQSVENVQFHFRFFRSVKFQFVLVQMNFSSQLLNVLRNLFLRDVQIRRHRRFDLQRQITDRFPNRRRIILQVAFRRDQRVLPKDERNFFFFASLRRFT